MYQLPASKRREPVTITARALPVLASLWMAGACAAPQRMPLSGDAAADRVRARVVSGEEVAAALDLAGLQGIALVPPDPDLLGRPEQADFWRACAWTWSPRVRAALRAAEATLARSRSAGAPRPAWLRLVDHEFDGEDTLVESIATFDLIGLLGLGPSEAARELASVEALAALGNLELALWEAELEVERARIRLAAARERSALLQDLVQEAATDLGRVDVLLANGRVGSASADMARARVHAVQRSASAAREAVLARESDLAQASGLPVGHPALSAPYEAANVPDPSDWMAVGDEPDQARHPRLRAGRLVFAVAEARVRRVAARAWPGIRIGPHLAAPSGNLGGSLNLGGALQLELPFPSSWRGELTASEADREAAREAYEDTWLALAADLSSARGRLAEVRARQDEQTIPLADATAAAWRARRAAFRVQRSSVDEWGNALMERAGAVTLLAEDDEAIVLAAIDVRAARGPAPAPGTGGAR